MSQVFDNLHTQRTKEKETLKLFIMEKEAYLKMMDFSNPKPHFNYCLGWKEAPIIEDKKGDYGCFVEVSTEEIKRRLKNK